MSTPYNGRSDEWGDEWGSYSEQNPPTQQFPPQGWDQQQGWEQPQQASQPYQQPQYTQYDQVQMQPAPAAGPEQKSNTALYVLIAVLAVALLAAVGFMVLRGGGSQNQTTPAGSGDATALFTEDKDEDEEPEGEKSDGEKFGDKEEKTSEESSKRESEGEREPSRTSDRERFGEDRDGGRGESGGRSRDREFGDGQAETSLTSAQFASAVGRDFRNYFAEHGEAPSSLTTYSTVTGLSYDMSCRAVSGGFRCTGGNNASVFIPEL